MRLHTNYADGAYRLISDALRAVKDSGRVPADVCIEETSSHGSRTHNGAVEFRLAFDGVKVRGDGRRWRNTGKYGADNILSATYDEHGWLMAEIYQRDSSAVFAGMYENAEHFHARTANKYAAISETVSS